LGAVGGLMSPRPGLHQAAGGGREQKEETEVAGDANTRLDAIDDAEVETGEAVIEASARRVSSARLDDLSGTTVETDSDEAEEDMEDPRGGS